MTALSAARNIPEKAPGRELEPMPAKAQLIYEGALVVTNGAYAAKGATATGLVAIGVAAETVDNAGGSDGDKRIRVKKGIFGFKNSASGDLITRAEIGKTVYVVDDQTLAKTDGTGTRSAAGKVFDVDDAGTVYLDLR